jgi:glycosyltransferase involved in cell wall biosynthesis
MNGIGDKRPFLSIVLPILNAGPTLDRAIQSIVSQPKPSCQIIVVDGGSDDQTHEILGKYRALIDVLIVQPDTGQSQAINRGFAQADGEWFGWLCGDDEFAPKAFALLAQAAEAYPLAEVISGACRRVMPDGSSTIVKPPADSALKLAYRNPFDQPSTFWRRSCSEKVGQIDETLNYAMDWDWWCRLAKAECQFHVADALFSNYHFSHRNKTSRNPEGNRLETMRILRTHGAYGGGVADIYKYIFEHYDLKGCLDKPPTAPRGLLGEWERTKALLRGVFGNEVLDNYNLSWISRQQRGLKFV